ncbi:DUF3592 domain-containing protein [Streptomyces sp. NPDC101118]|uniref:DUF3592 domain-containing protein n=1 Tax=Streptomyces sp. NPDC101118 TaxID=3366109 RepID=UPI00380598F0
MGDLIAMWLVTVVGVAGCVAGVVWTRFELGFKRRAIPIDAEVVGVREHEDGDGDVHFYPIVRFTPPGGATVQGESHARINAYTPPDTISVFYDPRDPENFSEDPRTGVFGSLVLLVFCLPAAAGGLWWHLH